MGKIRDAERTRKKILEAAKEDFFENGYNGARIESIAKRAGVNKQLIYHYFKGKEDLINETIANFISTVPPVNLILPANPAQIASFRYKVNQEYLMDFLKFTAWEAIEKIPPNSNGEDTRKKVLHSYVEDMRSKQEIGVVPEHLDPALITLMLSSLTIYPLLYGNVTRLITGLEPEDPKFQDKWTDFLDEISKRIFKMDS